MSSTSFFCSRYLFFVQDHTTTTSTTTANITKSNTFIRIAAETTTTTTACTTYIATRRAMMYIAMRHTTLFLYFVCLLLFCCFFTKCRRNAPIVVGDVEYFFLLQSLSFFSYTITPPLTLPPSRILQKAILCQLGLAATHRLMCTKNKLDFRLCNCY